MVDTASRSTPTTSGKRPATVPTKPARDEVAAPSPPRRRPTSRPRRRLDVEQLGRQLLGTWADIRVAARERAARPELQRIEGLTMAEHRERVLGAAAPPGRAAAPCSARSRRALGGYDDHGGNIAAVRGARARRPVAADQGGRAVGPVRRRRSCTSAPSTTTTTFLPGGDEPGGPRRVRDDRDRATARMSPRSARRRPTTRRREEFVINTPFRGGVEGLPRQRGHCTGRAAVVFAQLITNGVNHGVHAFYVPIRDDGRAAFLPGVGGEDDGLKGGLNGIDNGRLHFTTCASRAPTCSNRYGDVAEDGTYTLARSTAPGAASSRCSAPSCRAGSRSTARPPSASKLALAIALTYGNQRRQFTAASDTDEEVLLDYQRHQRRLLPRLAHTYAMIFAHDEFLVNVRRGVLGRGRHRRRPRRTSRRSPPRSSRSPPGTRSRPCRRRARPAAAPASWPRTGSPGCAPTWTSTRRSRATTTCCCSSSRSGCSPTTRSSSPADAGALAAVRRRRRRRTRAVPRTGLRRAAQSIADFGSTARSVGCSCATTTSSASCSPSGSRR